MRRAVCSSVSYARTQSETPIATRVTELSRANSGKNITATGRGEARGSSITSYLIRFTESKRHSELPGAKRHHEVPPPDVRLARGRRSTTAADEDSDEDEDVQPPRPARAMFDAASSVTDSDKSLRGNSCAPPDLPPRDGPTTTTTEKAPPPLPPRGAVAKSPSRASPYAGLGK